jgi:hypothetical protein
MFRSLYICLAAFQGREMPQHKETGILKGEEAKEDQKEFKR